MSKLLKLNCLLIAKRSRNLFDIITIYLLIALKLGGVTCLISSAKLFHPFPHLNCTNFMKFQKFIAKLYHMIGEFHLIIEIQAFKIMSHG
jgi:hypothetical protein